MDKLEAVLFGDWRKFLTSGKVNEALVFTAPADATTFKQVFQNYIEDSGRSVAHIIKLDVLRVPIG
jgi:hypothetical protein